jgi:NADH-quinone oxidoreductase subunit L
VQLFFGWEGVGLTSYLLIGFWYTRPSAVAAAIKAFIVNRVADFAFMLGIAATFVVFDSVQFDVIFADAAKFQDSQLVVFGATFDTLNVVAMLLFIGAMGKSAQLGLHTWLPDAMEGPTPISALIHAATMVTAGVFLVVRMSPVFEYAPDVLAFVAFIGGSTAFFAATIAVVQTDIKRVIAYSTCSQLGYMFAACGVSAYPAAIFHLGTNAFFKSLLFLSAGSVITAIHEEQDMRKMGGLWRKMPITYAVMFIGALALSAIPFFAGYYSKVLADARAHRASAPLRVCASSVR